MEITRVEGIQFKRYLGGEEPTAISLTPGDLVEFKDSYPTEEGYHWRRDMFEWLPQSTIIQWEHSSGGRDCDGEHGHYQTYEMDISLPEPEFVKTEGHQYDQFAEMMGY